MFEAAGARLADLRLGSHGLLLALLAIVAAACGLTAAFVLLAFRLRGGAHGISSHAPFRLRSPGVPAVVLATVLFLLALQRPVTGSLSAYLWLRAARSVGSQPSIAPFTRFGAVLVALSIAAALAAG